MRTCQVLAAGAVAAGAAALPAAALAGPQAMTPTRITATATDFRFRMSTTRVTAGRPVVLTLVNKGPSPHDWAITGVRKTRILAPSQRQTIRFTISKKGRYRFICTVPRHAQFGMVGDLVMR